MHSILELETGFVKPSKPATDGFANESRKCSSLRWLDKITI